MIFFRQGPNAVEMVRQDDDGVDAQRVTFLYGFESLAKCVNRRFIGQNRFALMCDQSEEIAAAGEIIAPVVHGASLFVLEYQITTQCARKREDIRATHCRRYALRVDTVSPNEPQPLSNGLWFIFFLVRQHAVSDVHQFSHGRAQR